MERIAMSQEERNWLEWLKRAEDGVITQRDAAEEMGVSDRRVRTPLKRKGKKGDAVVVHGLRGTAVQSEAAGGDEEASTGDSEAAGLA